VNDVLRQSFPNWHLVVVNDGGDSSAVERVIESHAAPLGSRVTLLHVSQRRGMEAAANLGVANSKSRYVAIRDDDDTWHPAFLAKTVARMGESGPNIGGIVTGVAQVLERFDANRMLEIRRRALPTPAMPITAEALQGRNLFPPISFLFTRRAFDAVGPFREDLPALGDWDFNIRFARTFEIVVLSEVLALWHIRRGARGAHQSYANSPYRDHLAALMKLRREWGRPPPLWRYLMLWRY
jgi:glycosyltransferase involved in cell wall biosynthesis